MALPKKKARYTVGDYMSWPDTVRCEIIGGAVHDMAPAPGLAHLTAVLDLAAYLRSQLGQRAGPGRRPCHVFVAPVDVVLGDDTVVQPDIVVVCDPAKLAGGKNVQGAPDLVVEVLSPATAVKDKREK
jgi:Uma2 family endonuclease